MRRHITTLTTRHDVLPRYEYPTTVLMFLFTFFFTTRKSSSSPSADTAKHAKPSVDLNAPASYAIGAKS